MTAYGSLDEILRAVPVAVWDDGTTVHSVLVATDDHEYWVIRDGQVVARCPNLAAVGDWQMDHTVGADIAADTGNAACGDA